MIDLLGFERFDRHRRWRCAGRIEDADLDGTDLAAFVLHRRDQRWLLTNSCGQVVVVGDERRDLVARDGGLQRCPSGAGFAAYLSGIFLRRLAPMDVGWIASLEVRSAHSSERAGRQATDIGLDSTDGELRLSVDAESGIWTGLATEGVQITVDELILDPPDVDSAALAILDWLPDIDLSLTEPPSVMTQPVIAAVELASGLTARVLAQDDDTHELRLVLLDAHGQPRAVVSRTRGQRVQAPRIFGGARVHEIDPEWDYVVDTSSADQRQAQMILNALPEIIDGEQRQRD